MALRRAGPTYQGDGLSPATARWRWECRAAAAAGGLQQQGDAVDQVGAVQEVAKNINVYWHNEHEGGGQTYQQDAQLDWFANVFGTTS